VKDRPARFRRTRRSNPVPRRPLWAAIGAAACSVAIGGAAMSPAAAEPAHTAPQGPSAIKFAPDVPALNDSEWGFRIGGFGGVAQGAPRNHIPVIFVHGNNVDASDWYPVRDQFKANGWTTQEMFALSYNGLGGTNGTALFTSNPEAQKDRSDLGFDGVTRITNDDVNVPDLYAFIHVVQAYTGSQKFSLVGHSLGVTLARRTLKVHPELRANLVAFVGIAGANKGTTFCPPGSEGNVVSCNEIAANTPWLADLNGPNDADQTHGPAKWMTIYDGTGAGDPAYVGPTYALSPMLKGADNRPFPNTYHNDLRLSPPIVEVYRAFLESAEKPFLAAAGIAGGAPAVGASRSSAASVAAARASRAPGTLAATGPTLPAVAPLVAAFGLAVALGRRKFWRQAGFWRQ